VEWAIRAAVSLPARLNAEYRVQLPAVLTDPDALLARSREHIEQALPAVADAVVRWLVA
jgi:hypothetical protein